MAHVDEQVTVWMTRDGRPVKMEWRTERFTVSDTPTRIGAASDAVLGFVTHPPRFTVGWRFQGTAGDGASHVFDIGRDSFDGHWKLLRTYD